jgi:hypothetical protein
VNGDLADSHNILNGRKNCFSKLLRVHSASDVRQIDIHTAELLVPAPDIAIWLMPRSVFRFCM